MTYFFGSENHACIVENHLKATLPQPFLSKRPPLFWATHSNIREGGISGVELVGFCEKESVYPRVCVVVPHFFHLPSAAARGGDKIRPWGQTDAFGHPLKKPPPKKTVPFISGEVFLPGHILRGREFPSSPPRRKWGKGQSGPWDNVGQKTNIVQHKPPYSYCRKITDSIYPGQSGSVCVCVF